MTITLEQLTQIARTASRSRLKPFVDPLNDAMAEFEINNPSRQAAFLAQVSHESGSFYYVREIASGRAYEGRKDLGNTEPGDGPKYKGRGLLQITGRENYGLCGEGLSLDLINHPYLLEEHPHSSRSAAWFWSEYKNLNQLADKGDFLKITKRINGGYNGIADRLACYECAKSACGLT